MGKPTGFRQVLEFYGFELSRSLDTGVADVHQFRELGKMLESIDVPDTTNYSAIREKANASLFAQGSPLRFGDVGPSKFNPSTGKWDPQGSWFSFKLCVPHAPNSPMPGSPVEFSGAFKQNMNIIECKYYVFIAVLF